MDTFLPIDELKKSVPGLGVRTDVPWSALTALGVGAAAPVMAEPADERELSDLLRFLRTERVPAFVLGGGSNLVGSDDDIGIVAIKLGRGFRGSAVEGTAAKVGAGAKLSEFVVSMAEKGLGGLAPLAGIPGTVGGAAAMNAGADGVEIGDVVEELRGILPDGSAWSAFGDEIEWRYRGAALPAGVVLTEISVRLRPVDSEKESAAVAEAREARATRNPRGRSAGCAFKNPFPELPAGKALDLAGCKGMARGGAAVSEKHANFVLNEGEALEEDVAALLADMRTQVFDKFGVPLEPEIRFVSEKTFRRVVSTPEIPKVLLLKGGDSSEREVSLLSGAAVEKALLEAGFEVESVDVSTLENATAAIERAVSAGTGDGKPAVFPVLHGGYGEDGRIQRVLEERGIPFVGSGSKGCAVAMDKAESKKAMERAGIPTPKYAVVAENDGASLPEGMRFPVVVKPAKEGSSVGMAIVHTPEEWKTALSAAFEFDSEVIAEEFVEGVEITVGVVEGEPLPPVEIRFPGEMYDYDAKYVHGKGETLYFCPPERLSNAALERAAETALAFARAVDSTALTRVDMIVSGDDAFVLEANNIPGFTSHSLLPKAAAAAGYPFPSLCGKLVRAAFLR